MQGIAHGPGKGSKIVLEEGGEAWGDVVVGEVEGLVLYCVVIDVEGQPGVELERVEELTVADGFRELHRGVQVHAAHGAFLCRYNILHGVFVVVQDRCRRQRKIAYRSAHYRAPVHGLRYIIQVISFFAEVRCAVAGAGYPYKAFFGGIELVELVYAGGVRHPLQVIVPVAKVHHLCLHGGSYGRPFAAVGYCIKGISSILDGQGVQRAANPAEFRCLYAGRRRGAEEDVSVKDVEDDGRRTAFHGVFRRRNAHSVRRRLRVV